MVLTEDGLPLVIVRPFNVYGPRQVGDGAIRGIILQAIRNLPITLYNDGTQIRAGLVHGRSLMVSAPVERERLPAPASGWRV